MAKVAERRETRQLRAKALEIVAEQIATDDTDETLELERVLLLMAKRVRGGERPYVAPQSTAKRRATGKAWRKERAKPLRLSRDAWRIAPGGAPAENDQHDATSLSPPCPECSRRNALLELARSGSSTMKPEEILAMMFEHAQRGDFYMLDAFVEHRAKELGRDPKAMKREARAFFVGNENGQ